METKHTPGPWLIRSTGCVGTDNMVRAPSYQFRVEMERKRSINARENQRQIVAYVMAPNEDDAKREAKRMNKEFFPIFARKV